MSDPRIERTRLHVVGVVRELLADGPSGKLNFSIVSEAARVSRRTLYTHWGDIEHLIGDAAAAPVSPREDDIDLSALSEVDRLRAFLLATRDSITDPIALVALGSLLSLVGQDQSAAETLAAMNAAQIDSFSARVAPIDEDRYIELVGPIIFAQLMLGRPISDDTLDDLVARGTSMLSLANSVPARA
jgi:AcrR family transcriptional regulator